MSGRGDAENDEEKRKIRQMYKEKNSQKDSNRVDFLYKDKVDSEEYLLGKRVDAHYERENIPQRNESGIGAAFDEDPAIHNERINNQIKQRDDPLSAIRKREEDARRSLLNNPMKMKQLEKALKEKRAKRHSKDGDELLARYMAIKGAKLSNVKEERKKRKLPDDDKSLLRRYLELIGKARRKRFYSDTSDEEDDVSHRPRSDNDVSRGEKEEHQSDRHRQDDRERNDRQHSSRHRPDRGDRHDERRDVRGRGGEREHRVNHSKDHRTNRDSSRERPVRSNNHSKHRDNNSDSHKDSVRSRERTVDKKKDECDKRYHSRSEERDRNPRSKQKRSVSKSPKPSHRSRRQSASRSPKHSDRSRKRSSSRSPKRSDRSRRRSSSRSPKLLGREHRPSSNERNGHSRNQIKLEQAKSKDRGDQRRDKSASSESKRHHSDRHKRKSLPTKRRHTPSSSSSDDEHTKDRKAKTQPQKSVERKKKRESSSSSSSSSSSGSDSSSSSHSDSTHSSANKSKTKRKLGPELPPSTARADRRRSSSSEVKDESLQKLEDERRELKAQLSKLPTFGLVHPKGESALQAKADADSQRKVKIESSAKRKSPSPKPSSSSQSSKSKERLTEEEKKARLKEMMDNAEWRDEQRAQNVARYVEEQRREDEEYARNAGKNDDFIAPMMTKHAGETSVEEQLRRNRKKIQRTSGTEKNFARK